MSSKIGFKGLLKKVTILVIVALANVVQQLTGDNVAIREIVIVFYMIYKSGRCIDGFRFLYIFHNVMIRIVLKI
ncbi:MAG: phage holin family protein [Clostridia bacterium]|nr:phage holin family protein [Clostridia bacterium]